MQLLLILNQYKKGTNMANNNSIITKYNDYKTEHSDDIPGGRNIIGILENETLEDIFRVFGGTVEDTPHKIWGKISDAVYAHIKNHNVVNLPRTIQ